MNRVGRGIFIVLMFGVVTLFTWTALAQREGGGAAGGLQAAVSLGQDRPEKSTFVVILTSFVGYVTPVSLAKCFSKKQTISSRLWMVFGA